MLVPIRKSPEWWALAQDRRQAYFDPRSGSGYIAIGNRYAAKIYRRLYQSRFAVTGDGADRSQEDALGAALPRCEGHHAVRSFEGLDAHAAIPGGIDARTVVSQ